jgi:hypothetical protein
VELQNTPLAGKEVLKEFNALPEVPSPPEAANALWLAIS